MKKIFILILFPILTCCCGNKQQQAISPQTSKADIEAAIELFVKGIMAADESILKSITADELVYGHSSGKVQNQSEFVDEICSGKPFVYLNVKPLEQTIKISGDVAVVRHIFTSETKNVDGEPGNIRIGNVLIWQLQDGKWKLLARQAYKL